MPAQVEPSGFVGGLSGTADAGVADRHVDAGPGSGPRGVKYERVTSLADAVLPLIRTRSDLYRYGAANAHGRDMHEAVDILEAAIRKTDPPRSTP